MNVRKSNRPRPAHRQQGVALIISLILLVITTLLGLAAIRGITQEERMAGQSYSRSLAFQVTESALRQAEILVEANKNDLMPTSGCSDSIGVMMCSTPAATDDPRWMDDSFGDWTDLSAIGSGTLAITPQYFVEYLGDTFPCDPLDNLNNQICKRFRITARSADNGGSTTAVMLQSVYATTN